MMIKEIKYGGYSAKPSDYESQDGELALALNLVDEDGELKAINAPDPIFKIPEGERLVLIHKVPGQQNFIFLKTIPSTGEFELGWFRKAAAYPDNIQTTPIKLKYPLSFYKDISIVGNTLCVATSAGVDYILWKDGAYKHLGSKPPFLSIRFGCYSINTLNSTIVAPGEATSGICRRLDDTSGGLGTFGASWSDDDAAYWHDALDAALGEMFSELQSRVISQGFVYQPFFIRYAYKLYDGSYSWHSSPILMLPMVIRPIVKINHDREDGKDVIKFLLDINYYAVSYRIFGNIKELKDDWSDIITDIDVFMSAPIFTYEQDATDVYPVRFRSFFSGMYSASTGEKYLAGIWASLINGEYKNYYADSSSSAMNGWVLGFKANENFEDRLKHESLFYKVSSLNLNEIEEMSEMKTLPLLKKNLTNITTLERLPDDYNSHATIIPGALHSYNQRLIMTNTSTKPAPPFSFCSMITAVDADNATSSDNVRWIKVYTRINDQKCVARYDYKADDLDFPIGKIMPRYFFHPDAQAYMMEVYTTRGYYRFPLRQHPFLNGAYWYSGLVDKEGSFENAPAEDTILQVVNTPNKVYLSEVNNPFFFPVESIFSISCNEVFRISSAAKALSQGQFGQFPLYAFTDEGVWALEVDSKGAISVRQPITRDVCINPDGITQLDNSVLFPTSRGIMILSGSQSDCITDSINSDNPFDILSLPEFKQIHDMLGHDPALDKCIPLVPFSLFLSRCKMVYDYIRQRIFLYAPAIPYAYVYSLKTKKWSMTVSNTSYHFNSYPEAWAVNSSNELIDLSKAPVVNSDEEAYSFFSKGIIVTRPLKLDMPNVLKTVRTVIQRGHFRRGAVATVLYGSRNLIDWQMVWSSKDQYLRGFSGTPYKYFVIVGLTHLQPGEYVYGASIEFEPRKVNQLR